MPADGFELPSFRVDSLQQDGQTRIVLAGEIDLAARSEVEEAIGRAAGRGRVVLDLTEVSFLDSTGIGAIARAVREHVDVSIVNPRPVVLRALEVSGILPHLHVLHDDDASAPS